MLEVGMERQTDNQLKSHCPKFPNLGKMSKLRRKTQYMQTA